MMITCVKHDSMLFHKGGAPDTHEIQGKSRELLDFYYIGHSDLYNVHYGMSCMYSTLLGSSRYRAYYPTSKKSKCS